MKPVRGQFILMAALLMLASCGDKSLPPAAPKMLEQERGALDKAKGVEQTQAKNAEDLKREQEKQTQ